MRIPQRGEDALIGEMRAKEMHHGCRSLSGSFPAEHKSCSTLPPSVTPLWCVPSGFLIAAESWLLFTALFFLFVFFTTLRERASSRKNSLGRCYPETLSMQLSFHAAARPQHRLAAASVHNNSELTPWQQTAPFQVCIFHPAGLW